MGLAMDGLFLLDASCSTILQPPIIECPEVVIFHRPAGSKNGKTRIDIQAIPFAYYLQRLTDPEPRAHSF
jgi:hypothetical protein